MGDVLLDKNHYFIFDEGYFYRPWGNFGLRDKLGKNIVGNEPIGEAWLISDREEFRSTIVNGPMKGININELTKKYPEFLFGVEKVSLYPDKFPLLLKLIDANELLSVQVHPDDEKAKDLGEDDTGKTEMWYIIDAKPNSFLYVGLRKNVKKEHLLKEIQNKGDVDRLLNKVYVKPGDYFLIPAGTVHAIGPGIIIAEIQQNSNITYRLFDWNRVDSDGKPRELHLNKAIQSIKEVNITVKAKKLEIQHAFGIEKYLCSCPYFTAKYWEIEKEQKIWNGKYTFHILLSLNETVLEIGGDILKINRGEAILIPAGTCSEVNVKQGVFLDYYQI